MNAGTLTATAARRSRTRKKVRYGLKLVLALGMIAWLAGQGGWKKIGACLAGASPAWFLLAVLTYLVGQSLCAWKWGLLAGGLGFRKPLRFYWVNYLGAMFPSLFLPTSVGGDVFRVVALAADGGDKGAASVSVLADRGTGLLAMVWIAAVASAIPHSPALPPLASRAIYLLCAGLTLGFAVPFSIARFWQPKGFLARVLACWRRPSALLLSVAAGFVFQTLVCVIYVLLGRALALEVPPAFYFIVCPIASIAAMSPITINGLGERTAALVLLLALEGVASERAVALGLAWTALTAVAALVGGVVLMCAGNAEGEGAGDPAAEGTP